ncbi:endo alpha-1,4 polygalactosaminidase [Cryobacterium sp. PH31-O1]|uniref:endo alpha-1,4 polygalactosaminidase n=1 Tax=Cryobacterium sp. PH31-O1 TaxID=3046306 RepID=UPI0024BAE503|nr:endo alpha-1,4 polygalactosaminidase [Cryobacterium sp. PH31-O1]MDJ0337301.1 endo alpha-1,4 polygalactosaminidase [Cryobacterium sp. PH31-O1]
MLAVALLLSGCAADLAVPPGIVLPPTSGAFDYQLGGSYPPPDGVTVVTRDSNDEPAQGIYTICYVNGFQTQPGVSWPSSLVVKTASGVPLVDPGWPDEHLLDISTADKRRAAAEMQAKTIAQCKTSGFQAVEFDNLDSYTRSKDALTGADAIAFAKLLVSDAHADGLAAGQKNTAQLGSRGKSEIGFDFAMAEECDRFAECDQYAKVYGAHVIDVEYTDDLRDSFAEACARQTTAQLMILRDRELVPHAAPAYVYQRC